MRRKKLIDRYILNASREFSNLLPPGRISEREGPDFVLESDHGEIGIEVTRLLRPKGTAAFPLQQAESFHEKVVRKAEALYRQRSLPEVDVLASFVNDCKRRDLLRTAESVVNFVSDHYQVGESQTFDRYDEAFLIARR